MSDRLYYADAYCTRFAARVIARAEEGRRVYLDRSAFYPTSGGQPHDTGTLGGVAVTDVVDEGERVAHLLAAPLAQDEVEGVVDWGRRWDHMQQHTGQHLLSALAADGHGWPTLSVHFGPEGSTLDLGVESIAPSLLQALEQAANAAVAANHAVRVDFEDAASVEGLRKASDRSGMLRVVSIEGVDRSACGGTHVRRTGEIGAIVLRRVERVRKATRVEFLCGARAIARVRADHELLARLAQGLSCGIDELATLVPAQGEQLRALDNDCRRLEEAVSALRAREAHGGLVPDASGIRRLVERRPAGKAEASRAFALAFSALPRAVYVSVVAEPPAILVAASEDSGVDAGRALKGALGTVGGRGGGSARLAQGTVPDAAALEAVVAMLATVAGASAP
jgi:alanyl-tRNA synthetase